MFRSKPDLGGLTCLERVDGLLEIGRRISLHYGLRTHLRVISLGGRRASKEHGGKEKEAGRK